MAGDGWFGGHLVELGEDECWELLAATVVGRVAYDDGDGPVVIPVNHLVRERTIRLRTAPHSSLGRHLNGLRVAFQVDDVDAFHQSGWSVLLRGRASVVDANPRDDEEAPTPWADGIRPLTFEIMPREVTGRRLLGG